MPEQTYGLTAAQSRRLGDVARRVEGIPKSRGLPLVTRLFAGDTEAGVNQSGVALPVGAAVATAYDYTSHRYSATLAIHPCISMFGLIASACAVDAECSILMEGIGMVLLDPAQASDVLVGDYVGLKANSYYAVPSNVNWMLVHETDVSGTPFAIVELRRAKGWRV